MRIGYVLSVFTGYRMVVNSFTPSRMGIITDFLLYKISPEFCARERKPYRTKSKSRVRFFMREN
jgi:hypothetical protein